MHIGPDETDTLAHIPAALLFPAPRMPPGHVLMGYDERGHCPMLVENACSIYEHRPATCRTYDCRIFPAAGVEVEGDDKALIAQRARRWRFDFPTPADRVLHDAVKAAAAFVREHPDALPPGACPGQRHAARRPRDRDVRRLSARRTRSDRAIGLSAATRSSDQKKTAPRNRL